MKIQFKKEAEISATSNAIENGMITCTERGIYIGTGENYLLYDGLSIENFQQTMCKAIEPAIEYNGQFYYNITESELYVAYNNAWIKVNKFNQADLDLSEYAKKADIPDITNLATKDEIPVLDGYALKTDVDAKDAEIEAKIGDLTTLNTTAKDSVVNAINELNTGGNVDLSNYTPLPQFNTLQGIVTQYREEEIKLIQAESEKNALQETTIQDNGVKINQNTVDIGDKTQLKTGAKGDLTSAINEVYDTINGISLPDLQIKLVVDLVFPVGSVYISLNSALDPNTQFPNTTWVKISSGKFLENTTDAGQVGVEVAAGLPNIYGWISTGDKGMTTRSGGAFTNGSTRSGRTCSQVANSGADWCDWHFNASNSNAIYGRSSTVQPSSIKCFIWKRTA